MLATLRASLELEMARQNDLGLDAPHTDSNLGLLAKAAWAARAGWNWLLGVFGAEQD